MELYLINAEYAYNGFHNEEQKLFHSYKEATQYMEDIIKEDEIEVESIYTSPQFDYECGEYRSYEDGDYIENHTKITLKQMQISDLMTTDFKEFEDGVGAGFG